MQAIVKSWSRLAAAKTHRRRTASSLAETAAWAAELAVWALASKMEASLCHLSRLLAATIARRLAIMAAASASATVSRATQLFPRAAHSVGASACAVASLALLSAADCEAISTDYLKSASR